MTRREEWRVVRLVAAREIRTRGDDRAFLLTSIFGVLFVIGLIVIPALLERPDTYTIGLRGRAAIELGERIRTADAASPDLQLSTQTLRADSSDSALLASGHLDAIVTDAQAVTVAEKLDAGLNAVLQDASQAVRMRSHLARHEITEAETRRLLADAPLTVTALDPRDPAAATQKRIATVGIFLLFGQVLTYAYWVASGVVEEKASRVVEVLLSVIRPWQLLAGKVLGIGVLGVCQLLVTGACALAAGVTVQSSHLTSEAAGPILLVLGSFLLGFAFYACLFAAAAATVSRQEELGNVTMPLQLVLMGSIFLAFDALGDSTSTLARVASYLPPTAPLIMPPRVAAGDAGAGDLAIAAVLTLGASVALMPLAGRMYSGSVLRMGARVPLRRAWAGGRSRPSTSNSQPAAALSGASHLESTATPSEPRAGSRQSKGTPK